MLVGHRQACHQFSCDEIAKLQSCLVQWYRAERRALPWRIVLGFDEQHFAWRVWVSEVMLQQTQVSTVVPYFERFMARFATLEQMANATEEQVNELWSGLGYYRRARFLLQGAQTVMRDFDGCIPKTVTELKKLPGVGPYTAGAIASIAFGQRAPIVDGNVVRVLSRLRAIGGSPKGKMQEKLFWELAEKLVTTPNDETEKLTGGETFSSCFNQSLMELGSEICTKTAPKCDKCPVSDFCLARRGNLNAELDIEDVACAICGDWVPESRGPEAYPAKKPKAKVREQVACCCLVECEEGKYALVKRPDGGLLGGMYEFPGCVVADGVEDDEEAPADDAIEAAMRRTLSEQMLLGAAAASSLRFLGSFQHLFTHIRQQMHVFHVSVAAAYKNVKTSWPDNHLVCTIEEIPTKAIIKSTSKALQMLNKKEKKKSIRGNSKSVTTNSNAKAKVQSNKKQKTLEGFFGKKEKE